MYLADWDLTFAHTQQLNFRVTDTSIVVFVDAAGLVHEFCLLSDYLISSHCYLCLHLGYTCKLFLF